MSLRTSPISAVAAAWDLNEARHFYKGTLGLEQADSSSTEELVYPCGEATDLVVYESSGNADTAKATIATWEVSNLDSEMHTLEKAGVEFKRYEQPGLVTDQRGIAELHDSRIAWFRDPDGNTFAISQD